MGIEAGGTATPAACTDAPRRGFTPSLNRGVDRPACIRLTGQSISCREGSPRMRAAAVQLNSNEDKERNLASANELTRAAAADGAQLVVLPEKFNVLGTHEHYVQGAETLEGPTISWARQTAAELGIDLVAGSIVERREGRDKFSNTCVHVSPEGDIHAVY